MEEKELIINKPNELFGVLNRKEYTKLTLNCEVSPKLLFGFDNIKELTVSSEEINSRNKVEENINTYPFIKNIEKLNFVNINKLGKKKKKSKKSSDEIEYEINFTNLKNINFTFTKRPAFGDINIFRTYLKKCNNLEEISFRFNNQVSLNYILGCPLSLKKLTLEFRDKKYEVNFDYNPDEITSLGFDKDSKRLFMSYQNDLIYSSIHIDVITDKVEKVNKLKSLDERLIIDNCLNIPDFITEINFDGTKNYLNPIEYISLNTNLLNSISDETNITDNKYLEILKTITIRNNSDMALYPSRTINLRELGILKNLYIKNNKLYIIYDKEILIVDSDGGITKQQKKSKELLSKEEIFQEKILEETKDNLNTFELDKYSISELELYLHYRKLLEVIEEDDEEIINTINSITKKLIKKLNKGETYE